jgi:hypothetical protein
VIDAGRLDAEPLDRAALKPRDGRSAQTVALRPKQPGSLLPACEAPQLPHERRAIANVSAVSSTAISASNVRLVRNISTLPASATVLLLPTQR